MGAHNLMPESGRTIRFRQLPLSDAEFRAIEGNVAPYMK